jgi:hypothetical protein
MCRYRPCGETPCALGVTPTDRRHTGQREAPAIGLHDYAVCDCARACAGRPGVIHCPRNGRVSQAWMEVQ